MSLRATSTSLPMRDRLGTLTRTYLRERFHLAELRSIPRWARVSVTVALVMFRRKAAGQGGDAYYSLRCLETP